MPTSGRKPTSASLGEVLEGLLDAGVDFILVGGLAAVIQGAPVTTMDVDVVHSQSPENIARLLSFLKTLIELKKTSTDPKDKQRLPVLKETLRQLDEKYGRREGNEDSDDE